MSVNQTMQAMKNLTLNEKGADAFMSTTDPSVDLFTKCSKNPYMSREQFVELYQLMIDCMKTNPTAFLQLISFQRGIVKGNGIKHYYHLGMSILEKGCLDYLLFKEMVLHTYQYSKDLYYLGRTGIEIYADKILDQIFSLLQPAEFDTRVKYDPMLFKYLAYEDGHWSNEKKKIQDELNVAIYERYTEFSDLVRDSSVFAKDEMRNRLGMRLREIFSSSLEHPIFTNKRMRLLKTTFNSEVNLPDRLFRGIHYDGTPLDETVDTENAFLPESVNKVAEDISHTSGIATTLMCKTLKKWQKLMAPNRKCDKKGEEEAEADEEAEEEEEDDTDKPNVCVLSQRKKLLIAGYVQHKLNLISGKTVAKELGVDLVSLAYTYYNTENDSCGLESLLNERIKRLQSDWLLAFDDLFTLEEFKNRFVCILDRSSSMTGTPIQNGLLYLLIMTKIFRLKELIYFDSFMEIRKITDDDLDGPILELLKKIYTNTQNYTELSCVFNSLEKRRYSGKIVMIITDSDCDPQPGSSSTSAFHNAFDTSKNTYLPENQYVIMNVKDTAMKFPFLSFHKKVAYVSGTSTIVFLIEALIECAKMNVELTPVMVLQRCLNSNNFKLPDSIIDGMKDRLRFSTSDISIPTEFDEIYYKWIQRLPAMKVITVDEQDIQYF